MSRKLAYYLIGIIFSLINIPDMFNSVYAQHSIQRKSGLYASYERLLDRILPLELDGTPLVGRVDWTLVLRIDSDPNDGPEIRVQFQKFLTGEAEVTISQVEGTSISSRFSEGEESLAHLASQIPLLTRTESEQTCPGLLEIAEDFRGIRLYSLPPGGLQMDATRYRFVVASGLDQYCYDFWGRPSDHSHPLIQWAQRLLAHLQSCRQ